MSKYKFLGKVVCVGRSQILSVIKVGRLINIFWMKKEF